MEKYIFWMHNINLIKIIAIFLSVFYTFSVSAQETLFLSQLLDSVQAHHPIMSMYDAEAKSLDAQASGAKNWMPPQFSIGTFMTPYSPAMWNANSEAMSMSSYMFSVQQMLPNKALQNSKQRYMQGMSAVSFAYKNVEKNELQQRAKRLYYEIGVLQKRKKLEENNQKLLEMMLKNTKDRYQNGLSKLDVYYKLKAGLGQTVSKLLQLTNEMKSKKIAINALMNRDIQLDFQVDTIGGAFGKEGNQTIRRQNWYESNHNLKVLEQKKQLNVLQIEIERKQLRPEWGVSFGHMQPIGNGMTRFSAMLMVNLPVFSWTNKMAKANIQKINFENQALDAQKAAVSLALRSKARLLQNDIAIEIEQMKLYREQIIPNYAKSFQINQLAFAQNTADLSTLYQAWEKLNEVQSMYLDILQSVFNNQVDLDLLTEEVQ